MSHAAEDTDISIAVVSASERLTERLQSWAPPGFQFKPTTSRRLDVLCFGPDLTPAQFHKWRTKFPKSDWIWLKEKWTAGELVALGGETAGRILATQPDWKLQRSWVAMLRAVREKNESKLSQKGLKKTRSGLEDLTAFVKAITGAADVFELLRELRLELKSLKASGDPVLLLAKTRAPSELHYFRGPQTHTRSLTPMPQQGGRVRVDDPADRQFLADHLGRPFGKVIAFPLAQDPGPGWQIHPVIFFEHQWDETELVPFIDLVGQRMQALSLVLDRLLLESELIRSSRLWERTFDGIEEPVAIVGLEGEMVRSNRQFAARGLTGAEQGLVKIGDALFNVERFDIRIKNRGPILSRVVHYHDLTKQMNLRERMIQMEKMSAIGHLAGHVAHELNNPLTGIRSLAQILMRETKDRLKDDLGEVERAAERCQEIILNLLDFSRGNLDAKTMRCDLNEIVTKTLPLLKSAMGRHSNNLALSEMPLIVDVEPQLMQQVVFNLVNNACQALGPSNGKLEILTSAVSRDGKSLAELTVTDSGPGVPKDLQSAIFEPFFTTKKEGQGTGLGLSFSRDFVRKLGGEIVCESEAGHGALFRVTLPLVDGEKSKVKILIIDDELLVRRSLQRVCTKRGHEVQEAEDGEAGLEVWNRWNPELVFLDVLMPKMSGLDVLNRFKDRPAAAVILMSAYTGSVDMSRELSERADLFIAKPFHDIFSVVDQAEALAHGKEECQRKS